MLQQSVGPARRARNALISLFLLLTSVALPAVEGMRVMALFSGKAMVQIDGQNRLLRVG